MDFDVDRRFFDELQEVDRTVGGEGIDIEVDGPGAAAFVRHDDSPRAEVLPGGALRRREAEVVGTAVAGLVVDRSDEQKSGRDGGDERSASDDPDGDRPPVAAGGDGGDPPTPPRTGQAAEFEENDGDRGQDRPEEPEVDPVVRQRIDRIMGHEPTFIPSVPEGRRGYEFVDGLRSNLRSEIATGGEPGSFPTLEGTNLELTEDEHLKLSAIVESISTPSPSLLASWATSETRSGRGLNMEDHEAQLKAAMESLISPAIQDLAEMPRKLALEDLKNETGYSFEAVLGDDWERKLRDGDVTDDQLTRLEEMTADQTDYDFRGQGDFFSMTDEQRADAILSIKLYAFGTLSAIAEHAPACVHNPDKMWEDGIASGASALLLGEPGDLRGILNRNSKADPNELVEIFLSDPLTADEVIKAGSRYLPRLHQLKSDPKVNNEVLDMRSGDAVRIAEPDAILGEVAFPGIVFDHFDLIGQDIAVRVAREATRLGEPIQMRLASSWRKDIERIANNLSAVGPRQRFHGNYASPQIVEVDVSPEQIVKAMGPDSDIVHARRFFLVTTMKSAGRPGIQQAIEVGFFVRRDYGRTFSLNCKVAPRSTNRAAMDNLIQESQTIGLMMERRNRLQPFQGGRPESKRGS